MKVFFKNLKLLIQSNCNIKPLNDFVLDFLLIIFSAFIIKLNQKNRIPYVRNFQSYEIYFQKELSLLKKYFPEIFFNYIYLKNQLDEIILDSVIERTNNFINQNNKRIDYLLTWLYFFVKWDDNVKNKLLNNYQVSKIENERYFNATQFFTDDYMVSYLINSAIHLIKDKDLENLVFLDPACGSGIFLVTIFEKLFALLKKNNYSSSDEVIVKKILSDYIFGYDLDSRISRLAQLSLFLKCFSFIYPTFEIKSLIYGGRNDDEFGFLNDKIQFNNQTNDIYYLKKWNNLIQSNKYKVILTNPPFLGKRDMSISLKNYIQKVYPLSKGDLCAAFTDQCLRFINGNGLISIVSQNHWMYLTTFKNFRFHILTNYKIHTCVDLGTRAFELINGEKTNISLFIIGNKNCGLSKFYNLKSLNYREKQTILNSKKELNNYIFEIEQTDFLNNPEFEFHYFLSNSLKMKIINLDKYSLYAVPMQGTSTGDNNKFISHLWEHKNNSDWKLVSKGGGYCRWAGLNLSKVKWGETAELIKQNRGSAIRNLDKISSTDFVYSDTGTLGLNVRLLIKEQIFIASGPGIRIMNGLKYSHLAYLNSRIASFFIKLLTPKLTISAGYISKIPVVKEILFSTKLDKLGKDIVKIKNYLLSQKITNYEYSFSEFRNIKNCSNLNIYLINLIMQDFDNEYKRIKIENIIENEILNIFKFNKQELQEIRSLVGESVLSFKKTRYSTNVQELENYILKRLDTTCMYKPHALNGYQYGCDSLLEDLCGFYKTNPEIMVDFIKNNIKQMTKLKLLYFHDLCHKIVLFSLGMADNYSIKPKKIKLSGFIKRIVNEFPILTLGHIQDFEKMKIEEEIKFVIQNHHKISFCNKPLIIIDNDTIVINQSL